MPAAREFSDWPAVNYLGRSAATIQADLRWGSCPEKPTLLFLPRPYEHSLPADNTHGAKVLCAAVEFGAGKEKATATPVLVLIGQETFAAKIGSHAAVHCLCELLMVRLLRHCLALG